MDNNTDQKSLPIYVSGETHRDLKIIAAKENKPMGRLSEEAIRGYIKKWQKRNDVKLSMSA